jgi:hypothetical protein
MKNETPPQPSLFDPPRPLARRRAMLPARDAVNRARDRAMGSVAENAEEHHPDFGDEARHFVLRYLETHGPTAGEVLTLACKAAGIVPHDDRAFGPVYFTLRTRGLIVKVGEVRRERGHGTAGGNVWSLP